MARRLILTPFRAVLAGLALLCGTVGPGLAQDDAAVVRVDTVVNGTVGQTVPVIGRLVARQAGEVAARINGAVDSFLVEVGDRVEADQVIASLETESLKARRDLAAGELAEAEALQATNKAKLGLAQQTLKRLEALKSSAAFSQARFEDASQEVVIAEAEVRESQAAIGSAKADYRMAEINLYNAEIRAPYAGVITQRMVEAGAYLPLGGVLVQMIADRNLEVEADVPFQRLSGLAVGTELAFTLDDGTRHRAVVRAVVPRENPLTRTRAVRFVPEFSKTENPVAVDQSATLLVPLYAGPDVLTVHKDAVLRRQGNAMVFVVKDDTAKLRTVTLGNAVGGRFEVVEGLAEGELTVIRGNERLRPDVKVRIDKATEPQG